MSSDNTLTETDLLHRILTFTPELADPLSGEVPEN